MGKRSKKRKNTKPQKKPKDLINKLDKTFDEHLAKAQSEAKATTGSNAAAHSNSGGDASAPSTASALVFAALAVGPCAALFASPKFGITLADNGVLLLAVALLSVLVLTQAYAANVEAARHKGSKASTAELHNYAIFFVNLVFLLLFLFVGFVAPVRLFVPTEVNYFLSVAGNAVFIYLAQKGVILKGF
eukprot:INCI16327.2.p1 GENE.INCI16327.2~~INCI16327.2.p1  ORF type:complete len:189 (-),score=33.84 INCI16327.2:866-1432(-)